MTLWQLSVRLPEVEIVYEIFWERGEGLSKTLKDIFEYQNWGPEG